MPIVSGTDAIKLQNVASLQIYKDLLSIYVYGDNLLDGVTITPSVGSTVKVASGKDRVTSEKVVVEASIVEMPEEDITKLMSLKRQKVSLKIAPDADYDSLAWNVDGILQVLRTVATNGQIVYKVGMEINAKDIDTELARV